MILFIEFQENAGDGRRVGVGRGGQRGILLNVVLTPR